MYVPMAYVPWREKWITIPHVTPNKGDAEYDARMYALHCGLRTKVEEVTTPPPKEDGSEDRHSISVRLAHRPPYRVAARRTDLR